VRVFCDAHPLTTTPWSIQDHSGLRILSLSTLPLTQTCQHTNNVSPLAAVFWNCSDEYRKWTFFLRDDMYWEDGTPITGFDYQRGFNFLAGNPSHRFRSLLSDLQGYGAAINSKLTGLKAQKHSISFQLRNSNRLWPLLLSFSGASPKHPDNPNAESGVYKFVKKSKKYFHLKLRGNFFKSINHPISDILFYFQTPSIDPFSINQWEQGIIDMTWDTFFPYYKREKFHQEPVFQQSRPRILTFLSPQGCALAPPIDLMHFLYEKIDRKKLSQKLNNCPTPLYGYCHQKLAPVPPVKPPPHKTILKVGYEAFFPNHEILMLLKEQLLPHGIFIEPIKVKYGNRPKSLHLRLELLHNPFSDPFLMLRNELAQKQFHTNHPLEWKQFAKFLTLYQKNDDISQCKQLALKMDLILIQQGRTIPLLELPGFYLCKQAIGYHDFQPGQHWSWTNNATMVS